MPVALVVPLARPSSLSGSDRGTSAVRSLVREVVVRSSYIMAALVAASLAFVAACGDDRSASVAGDTETKRGGDIDAKVGRLVRCQVRSGGHDVHAAGIGCEEVEDTIRHWGPAPVFGSETPPEGVFRRGDWLCWSRLERAGGKPFEDPSPVGGHILNVCMRGSQAIIYKFS